MLKYILGVTLLLVSFNSAEARHRYNQPTICAETDVMRPTCGMVQPFSGARSIRVVMHRERPARVAQFKGRQTTHATLPVVEHSYAVASTQTQIVAHPEGCPRSAFCGCGAAVRVFGKAVRELWLASNWFKFPRTSPAPGMVAVRNHHVFVLEQQASNGNWIVYDANSSGHATRIHERSLAGYAIVNPHAG